LVDTYNKTFNNLAADASYNNKALIFSYLQGLNDFIHSQIMLMSTFPTTLQEYQDKAAEFDICCNYNDSKTLDPYAQHKESNNNNELGSRTNPIQVERR
jgi:hypothetical protein